jgi:hypothetical protein
MESSPNLHSQSQSDVARLRDMIMGFRVTQLLYVAAKLNLPDHLTDGPQSADHVAAKVGAETAQKLADATRRPTRSRTRRRRRGERRTWIR